jgi:hypothetical protein
MPIQLIYQLLELLDHVTQLMRLLDRSEAEEGAGGLTRLEDSFIL